MNESFAKKLDDLSKTITGLATTLQEKANAIRDKVDKAIETKDNLRDVVYAGEILDWSKKCDEAKNRRKSNDLNIHKNFQSKMNI